MRDWRVRTVGAVFGARRLLVEATREFGDNGEKYHSGASRASIACDCYSSRAIRHADYPELTSALKLDDEAGGLVDAVCDAVNQMPEGPHHRAATVLFAEVGQGVSLKQRATVAAQAFGIGYDAFRKSHNGQLSRLDEVLEAVSAVVLAQSDVETADELADSALETMEHLDSGDKASPVLPVVVVVAAAIVVLWVFVRSPEGSDTAEAPTSSLGTELVAPVAESETTSSSETALPNTRENTCTFLVGEGGQPEVADLIKGVEDLPICARGPVVKLDSDTWFQEFGPNYEAASAVVVANDGAFFLDFPIWQSFLRVGGGDPELAANRTGVPVGSVGESELGWEVPMSGSARFFGERADGSFLWMPEPILTGWREADPDGEWGEFAGNLWAQSGGGFAVPFAGGNAYITETASVEFVPAENVADLAAFNLDGPMLRASDGSVWFVDAEAQTRHWVPNDFVLACAGESSSVVVENIPHSSLVTLDQGLAIQCPVSSPKPPRGGGLNLLGYCWASFGDKAGVERVDDVWVCVETDGISVEIDPEEACWWQYGREAIVVSSDPGALRCGR